MTFYVVIDTNVLVSAMLKMEERKEEYAYLVTGNIRHFPQKPFIVTPRQLIDIIAAEAE